MSLPIFTRGKKEDLRNSGLVGLIVIPWKVLEQITLESIPKLITDRKITGSSQHEFMKGKSSLTKLISFYVKMILTPKTFTDKLVKYGPNNRAVKKTVRHFSVTFIERARGKRHELVHGKLLLNITIIFYYDIGQTLKQFAQRSC